MSLVKCNSSSDADAIDDELTAILKEHEFDGNIESQLAEKLGREFDSAKIELGRLIFFDEGLGLHQDNSCGGCHAPTFGFGDSQSIAIGVSNNDTVGLHRTGPRNQRRTPTVINTAFYPKLMWDGRFSSNAGDPFDNSKGYHFPPPEGDVSNPTIGIFTVSSDYVKQVKHLLVAQAHIPFLEQPEMAGFTTKEGEGFVTFSRFAGFTNQFNAFDGGQPELTPLIFSTQDNSLLRTDKDECAQLDYSIFNDGEGLSVPKPDPHVGSNFKIRSKVLELINGNEKYQELFGNAFPDVKEGTPANFIMIGEVLAEFQMALTFSKAPIDMYAMGNRGSLTESEKRGAIAFFKKGGCVSCHSVKGNSNQMFSDFSVHNVGVPQIHPKFGKDTGNVPFSDFECGKSATGTFDFGLLESNSNPDNRFKFRTSPLRNIKLQPAFFHNGSFTSLVEAVKFHLNPAKHIESYSPEEHGVPSDLYYRKEDMSVVMNTLDPKLKDGIDLTEEEINDLVAFLENGLFDSRTSPEKLRTMIPSSVPSGAQLPHFE